MSHAAPPAPPRPLRYPVLDLALRPGACRLARPDGPNYRQILALLHEQLGVRRYIEIGMRSGTSLALAQGAVVGVDPVLTLLPAALRERPDFRLFAMTSDAFFATHDPKQALGGPADLAFVDGMHHHEFALRDFLNCEAHVAPGGAVVLHDVVPQTITMARRLALLPTGDYESFEGAWAGDVWRVLRVLRRWRPELRITVVDAPPTGLAIVTGLDPASTVLRDNLAAILAEEDIVGNTEAGWWEQMTLTELTNGRLLLAEPSLLRQVLGLPSVRAS